MAAQTVQYFTGSSKTLTRALLNDLFKGVAHITLMPFDKVKQATGTQAGGIKWEGLTFTGGDEIFTIKDSFQISQADATQEELNIDQSDIAIDTTVTAGEWTFSGNIPSVAAALCNVFYNKGVAITAGSGTGIGGQESGKNYGGQAYFATPVEVYATMLVENRAQNMAIAFARVKITVGLSKDDASNPAYLKMAGSILGNPEASGTQGDWAVVSTAS